MIADALTGLGRRKLNGRRCDSARLVIELDGGQHYDDVGQEKDRVRTDYLQCKGLDVLRFSNSNSS